MRKRRRTAVSPSLSFLVLLCLLLPLRVGRAQQMAEQVGSAAPETGVIAGVVTAQETGLALPEVRVSVLGTTLAATADHDGRFTIAQVPPGTYRLQARLIGYEVGEVPGVVVAAYGETIIPPRPLPGPEQRYKYRLGLGESGLPFTSIPTLYKVLETLFDVLEGISISVAIRSADMLASIAVFAGRLQSPTSRYQCRKRAVYREFVEALTAAKQRVCSSWARGEDQRVAAPLCQVSPEREVCIYRSRNWIVANKDWT